MRPLPPDHFIPLLPICTCSPVDALTNQLRPPCASSVPRLEGSATTTERVDQPLASTRANKCSTRLRGTLERAGDTSGRGVRSDADSRATCSPRLYETASAPFFAFNSLSTLSKTCLVSPSAGWPRSGNSGARSVGSCTSISQVLVALIPSRLPLTQDHPYGFWAKPKKAADGTLDMKTWETGIPGKEGVSPPRNRFAVTALVLIDWQLTHQSLFAPLGRPSGKAQYTLSRSCFRMVRISAITHLINDCRLCRSKADGTRADYPSKPPKCTLISPRPSLC